MREALIYLGTTVSTLIIPMQVQAQIPLPPAVVVIHPQIQPVFVASPAWTYERLGGTENNERHSGEGLCSRI